MDGVSAEFQASNRRLFDAVPRLPRTAERAAVVSTARLSLRYPGGPDDADISTTRMRKIVTKDIGILYFGLPQSSNPKSVLYNHIMGIEELDEVGDDF